MAPLRGQLDLDVAKMIPGGLEALADAEPQVPLRRLPGRVTFAWPEGDGALWVVKRYRSDLARDRWFDLLHGHPRRSPGRREFDSLQGLTADGLPVPRARGWAETGAGTSLVVMDHVPHRLNVSQRLLSGEDPRDWIPKLVPLVAALHGQGWYHRDLYLDHWVEGPDGPVLLDVGRARRQRRVRRRWFVKDLAALWHSLPRSVHPSMRVRWVAAYLDARGIEGRESRRAWLRRVRCRARHMARHRPKYDPPREDE